MKFRVVENLDEEIMNQFISWTRYVEFDGDLAHLYLAKNEAIQEAQRRNQHRKNNLDSDEDSDDMDLSDVFKGTSMKHVDIELETKVWKRIKKQALESIAQYPETIE